MERLHLADVLIGAKVRGNQTSSGSMHRRIGVLLTAVTVVGMLGSAGQASARAPKRQPPTIQPTVTSMDQAYAFLDRMMDLYATGTTPRLTQSYVGGVLTKKHYTDSVTYDDALMIDAFVTRGTANDISRAEVVGDGLLTVQADDPRHDGRIRAAYAPTPLTSRAAVMPTDATSDVGNMAWVGQALVQLYARTGTPSYLSGATSLAQWIVTNTYDTRGAGGYTGGSSSNGTPILWKSTEHNIDLYAFFTLLGAETGDPSWTARAAWARHFVVSMWNPSEGAFAVGTLDDGVSVNSAEQPEDVNSWSYLALLDSAYAASVTWASTHLSVTKHGATGVSFCAGDRSGVWYEGTAHLADALKARAAPGDAPVAQGYLADVATAQVRGRNADGLGIIASSKNGLRDCDGGRYYASLHTGATSWYVLAFQSADPFRLLP
jgi:hypothetical protein